MARLTPILHPETQDLVPNMITLATPHAHPLYAFDASISRVHQQLQVSNSKNLMVSISGGLRDEMIDPAACEIQDSGSSLSVSTGSA